MMNYCAQNGFEAYLRGIETQPLEHVFCFFAQFEAYLRGIETSFQSIPVNIQQRLKPT